MDLNELKQEAEEYAQGMAKYYESNHGSIPSQFEKYLRNAYISSAEPREKRIAELTRKLKVETELSKRLGIAYREYEQLTNEQDEHLAELEAQIEKMKRCIICKHYSSISGCSYHSNWVKDCKENGMRLFELKEIKENG